MPGTIPIVLAIDCEPDLRSGPLDDPSPWNGLEQMIATVDTLRDRFARATGADARLAWGVRMDPQIATWYGSPTWGVERYGGFFASAARAGDAIGLHVHAFRWEHGDGRWVADHASEEWIQVCANTGFDAYRDAFGTAPEFHLFGSFYMSTPLMNTARDRGARYDLSLWPGEGRLRPGMHVGVVHLGTCPDHEWIPLTPYRPSPRDFRRPANPGEAPEGFLAVPLTAGRFVPATIRSLLPDRSAVRSALWSRATRHAGTVKRTFTHRRPRPPYSPLEMWRDWRSPADFWDAAFAAADALASPYLAFKIRSDTPLDARARRLFDGIVEHLDHDARARRLRFVTPDEAFGHLVPTVHPVDGDPGETRGRRPRASTTRPARGEDA